MKRKTYKIKFIFYLLLCITFNCSQTFAPKAGVLTEISKLQVSGFNLSPGSLLVPFKKNIVNDTQTVYNVGNTIAEAKASMNNNGRIYFYGQWSLILNDYCCQFPWNGGWFVVIPSRDGVQITNNTVVVTNDEKRANNWGSSDFSFDVTFNDPTISTPENHVYALEFWECVGQCKINEYDKKTEKKAEVIVNYSLTP